MRSRGFSSAIFIAAVLAVLACSLFGGARAFASGTGWPLDAHAEPLTGFGERYLTEDGSYVTHRGVDLAADAGASVRAVLGGTVTFAGRVPAGEGATTIAVTVQTGDLRVTLMPLSEASVRAGDTVAPGERVGLLAGAGDRSHTASHLHVGVRRGDLYIDPGPFLCPPAPVSSQPEETGVRVPAPSTAPAVAPATQPAPVAATVPGQAVAMQPSGAGSLVGVEGLQVTTEARVSSGLDPVPAGSGAQAVVPARPGQVPQAGTALAADVAGAERVTRPEASTAVGVAARALDLEPDRLSAAMAVDRKPASVTSGGPSGLGALLGVAGLAAAALLWPVWRSVPVPGIDVAPVREDVAAAVSR